MLNRSGRVVLAGAILSAALVACTSRAPVTGATQPGQAVPGTPSTLPRAAAVARSHMEALANGIGGRYSGTPEERRAGDYVRSTFVRLGYVVQSREFGFNEGASANVVATKPGASPKEIVVGAHYDAVDDGDGADDNASGVAVLLAAAEQVRDLETPYTIRFAAFGAEEADDMFGSAHYVSELKSSERDAIIAMINIDSVVAGDISYVYGDADTLKDWTRNAASDLRK